MGRRLPTQAFLPNKWVFPGGRVDDADREVSRVAATSKRLSPTAASHLPFAYAAVRETFEEAGILVTTETTTPAALAAPHAALAEHFLTPALDLLKPLARAVTPPGLPRRFDTWFYMAEWNCSRLPTGTPDGELLDIAWFTLPEVLDLDLPIITRLIVDDVATAFGQRAGSEAALIPFYFQAVEGYRRSLISASWPWPAPDPQP
jgi:8-oxo-dGTP pyrophosphatase MutT (NUDIX family)